MLQYSSGQNVGKAFSDLKVGIRELSFLGITDLGTGKI